MTGVRGQDMELIGNISELAGVTDDAFAALVERQSRFVFRVAHAVVRNTADAEDIVQDVFLKLHRTGSWQRIDDERAFLARAAWRLAVERLPRRRAEALPELVVASHERSVIEGDLESLLHRLIDALPEELRQPLALSAIEELNSRQIGEVLGIPEGTVRTRLLRARTLLKEKLAARKGVR